MTTLSAQSALQRPRSRAFFPRLIAGLQQIFPARMPYISDRIADDIGLAPVERAHLHLQWPSDTYRHPML